MLVAEVGCCAAVCWRCSDEEREEKREEGREGEGFIVCRWSGKGLQRERGKVEKGDVC